MRLIMSSSSMHIVHVRGVATWFFFQFSFLTLSISKWQSPNAKILTRKMQKGFGLCFARTPLCFSLSVLLSCLLLATVHRSECLTVREFFIANYLRCCAASILEKLHFYAGRKAPKLLGAVRNGFCNVCAVVSINDRDVDFLLVLRADDRLGRGGRPGGRHLDLWRSLYLVSPRQPRETAGRAAVATQ